MQKNDMYVLHGRAAPASSPRRVVITDIDTRYEEIDNEFDDDRAAPPRVISSIVTYIDPEKPGIRYYDSVEVFNLNYRRAAAADAPKQQKRGEKENV